MLIALNSGGRLLTWHMKAKMAQLPLSSGIYKLNENFEIFAQCLMLPILNFCYYSRLTSTRPLKKCLAKKDWNNSAFGLSPIFNSLATPGLHPPCNPRNYNVKLSFKIQNLLFISILHTNSKLCNYYFSSPSFSWLWIFWDVFS